MDQPIIDLGTRRELFVDSMLIDRLDNARLVLNKPVPREVAIRFDKPWEGRFSAYFTVFQDGELFRLYYRGTPEHYDKFACTCYAESRDGITWEKPTLNLCEFQGSTANNVLFIGEPSHAFAPFIDTNPACLPEQRYKALGLTGSDTAPVTTNVCAFASPDGLHWKKMHDAPVLTKGGFDSHNVAFWSEAENCYVSYFRVWSKSPDWRTFLGRRSIGRATSPDFIHWGEPALMEFGDARTDELYTNSTLPYFRAPHLYVAFPKRFVLGRKAPLSAAQIKQFDIPDPNTFVSEGVFMTSRGGNRYDRTFMEGFFRPGPDPANWCSRNVMAAWGILQTGPAEMSLYYSQHYTQPSSHLVRASLRLDGFTSINAPYAGGELLTRPFVFSGTKLEINMATSGVGSIRVEVQDEAGKPLRDFGAEDCTEIYGDEIARTVKWQGSPFVTQLAGRPVRLRFVMKDADLYSLKFS